MLLNMINIMTLEIVGFREPRYVGRYLGGGLGLGRLACRLGGFVVCDRV